ncbi:hypothetical protein HQ496_07650, partial [bacterium]|nr:hypothetical protein [bacterium]
MKKISLNVCLACALMLLETNNAFAQSTIKLSGTIFSDYAYTFSSPEGARDGENGFDFR